MPSEQELESLVVRLKGDGSGYKRMLEEARSQTNLADGHFQLATQRINAMGMSFRGYGAQAAAMVLPLVGGAGLLAEAYRGINLAAQAEQDEVAFSTMLQSVGKGMQMVQNIQQFAAETPLGTAEINVATKALLQFGVAGQDIIPTLRMIGDIGGGNAEKLQHMAVVFGQIKAAGHLMGGDRMQLIQMGFNPLQEIGRTSGKGQQELMEMEEHGLITFKMVRDAFKSATSEGGNYFNLMEKQSHTASGLFSTMKDDIDAFLRNTGKALIENLNLKEFMQDISGVAQYWTKMFQQVTPQTLKFAAALISVVTVVSSLTVAVAILGVTFKTLFGGVSLLTFAIVTLVGYGSVLGATWVTSVGGINDAVRLIIKSTKEWITTHEDLLIKIGLGVVAVSAAVTVWRMLIGIWTLGKFLMAALHVQQIIGIGLWVAWKVVLLAVNAVWALWNFNVALFDGLIGAATAGSVLYTGAMLVMKGVIWLVNAALTAMDLLMSPIYILAFVATIGVLTAAFIICDVAARGLAGGIQAAFDLLGKGDTLAGPVGHIGMLLGEWFGHVKFFVKAIQSDAPAAMNFLATAGQLAWSQINDASKPMWEFLKDAGSAAWDYITRIAIFKAGEAAELWELQMKKVYHPDWDDEDMARYRKNIEDKYKVSINAAKKLADDELALAARKFKVIESEETKALKDKLGKQKNEIEKTMLEQAIAKQPALWGMSTLWLYALTDGWKKAAEEAENYGRKASHALGDANTALFGSAEMMRRMAAQDEMMHGIKPYKTGMEVGPKPRDLGVASGPPGPDMAVYWLQQIKGLLEKRPERMMEFAPANVK